MSKKYLQLALLVILFLLNLNLLAQQQTTEQSLQGFDEYVTKTMADWKVQGCGIAIVKNGAVIYAKGFGYRDVKNNLPADENTLFAIGSCTKAFTSTGVCILVDQGKIDLDKPVINYIPTFKLYDDYTTMNITPRDLMCHRSGLPRHDFVWYGSDLSRKEIIDRLRYLEPSKPFRTSFQYQNMMFLSAGYLTEQVSGMQWEDYIKENILTPLDMSNTDFTVNAMQQTGDYSKPYRDEKSIVKEIPFREISAMAPAGAINSSVKEMANWMIMQLNNGSYNGKQIVSSSSMNEMHTPQMNVPSALTKDVFYQSYGLGWFITSYRGHLRVEHGGNIDGFTADVALYPMDSIGIVILTNMENTTLNSIVRNYAMDKFFGLEEIDWNARFLPDFKKSEEDNKDEESNKDKDRVPDTEPSHNLSDYTGTFENPAYGKMIISMKDDKLHLSYHTFESELVHFHYDVFRVEPESIEGMKLSFFINSKGQIDKVSSLLEPSIKEIEFTRAPETKAVDFSKYIGSYELNETVVSVSERGDKALILTVPGQPAYELVSTIVNEFDIKGLAGYSVSFNVAGNAASELVFHQPNGVFTAKRKM